MTKRIGASNNSFAASAKVDQALYVSRRVRGEWPGCFESLDHGAEIDGFRIKSLPFRDLGPVQYFESVTLEELFAPPIFKSHDLAIDAALAESIKVIQVRAHKGAGRGNFSGVRQQVDVKMRNRSGRSWNLVPAVADDPANEFARALVVTAIAPEGTEKQGHRMPKRVELMLQRFA